MNKKLEELKEYILKENNLKLLVRKDNKVIDVLKNLQVVTDKKIDALIRSGFITVSEYNNALAIVGSRIYDICEIGEEEIEVNEEEGILENSTKIYYGVDEGCERFFDTVVYIYYDSKNDYYYALDEKNKKVKISLFGNLTYYTNVYYEGEEIVKRYKGNYLMKNTTKDINLKIL